MFDQEMLWQDDAEPAKRKPRKPRPPDPIWEQLEVLFGPAVPGTNAHAKRNKAARDLRAYGATPASLVRAKAKYHQQFDGSACTDIALATHYPLLLPNGSAPVQAPCSECGVGGGLHAEDCASALR